MLSVNNWSTRNTDQKEKTLCKRHQSIDNFLGEILGKDEIGPKPYGTIGVTLPGFLSISYISFPHRPHSTSPLHPLQVTWTDVKRSKVTSFVANGGHLRMSDCLDCPVPSAALFNPQMPRFPIFRVIKYSSSKFPMLVTDSLKISPNPHLCIFNIFCISNKLFLF